MLKRINKKIRIKLEGYWVYKNMKLKKEIKRLKRELEETKNINHKLIDQKTLDNITIRQLKLEGKDV